MSALFAVAGMLGRGGSPVERARRRLMTAGAVLATWFLLGGANVLVLHGQLDDRLGPVSQPGTRGGTALAFAMMLLPVAAFLYQSGRLASTDRERRLAALRLAGATPREVRLIGAVEATRTAVTGALLGAASFLLLQWAGRAMLLSSRSKLNVGVPPLLYAAAIALVVVTAVLAGLLAGRHVVTSPLGVTRRAARGRPGLTGVVLEAVGFLLILSVILPIRTLIAPGISELLILSGAVLMALGLPSFSGRLIWYSARVTGRRARSAETLLAARALEADARPWGRTMSVVGLAVAIGSVTGWIEADVIDNRHGLEAFWLTSFLLVDLALLVGLVVSAAALLVHQAEYLLEHGPVLAALRATGTSDDELRRVLVRQALVASAPVCCLMAVIGLVSLPGAALENKLWLIWPVARAVIMAGLGVLAAVSVAAASRRRLRRTVSAARLRTE